MGAWVLCVCLSFPDVVPICPGFGVPVGPVGVGCFEHVAYACTLTGPYRRSCVSCVCLCLVGPVGVGGFEPTPGLGAFLFQRVSEKHRFSGLFKGQSGAKARTHWGAAVVHCGKAFQFIARLSRCMQVHGRQCVV